MASRELSQSSAPSLVKFGGGLLRRATSMDGDGGRAEEEWERSRSSSAANVESLYNAGGGSQRAQSMRESILKGKRRGRKTMSSSSLASSSSSFASRPRAATELPTAVLKSLKAAFSQAQRDSQGDGTRDNVDLETFSLKRRDDELFSDGAVDPIELIAAAEAERQQRRGLAEEDAGAPGQERGSTMKRERSASDFEKMISRQVAIASEAAAAAAAAMGAKGRAAGRKSAGAAAAGPEAKKADRVTLERCASDFERMMAVTTGGKKKRSGQRRRRKAGRHKAKGEEEEDADEDGGGAGRETFSVNLNDIENISVRLTNQSVLEHSARGGGGAAARLLPTRPRKHPLFSVVLVVAGARRERAFRFASFRNLERQFRAIEREDFTPQGGSSSSSSSSSSASRTDEGFEILSPFPPSHAKSMLGVAMTQKELRARAILLNCWLKEVLAHRSKWTRRHRAAVALLLSEAMEGSADPLLLLQDDEAPQNGRSSSSSSSSSGTTKSKSKSKTEETEWSGESDSGLSEDEDEWDSSSDSEGSTGSSFESFKDEGEADGWEVVGEGAIEDAEENHPEDDADEDNDERVSSLLSDELIAWHRDSVAPIANKRGGRRSAVTLAAAQGGNGEEVASGDDDDEDRGQDGRDERGDEEQGEWKGKGSRAQQASVSVKIENDDDQIREERGAADDAKVNLASFAAEGDTLDEGKDAVVPAQQRKLTFLSSSSSSSSSLISEPGSSENPSKTSLSFSEPPRANRQQRRSIAVSSSVGGGGDSSSSSSSGGVGGGEGWAKARKKRLSLAAVSTLSGSGAGGRPRRSQRRTAVAARPSLHESLAVAAAAARAGRSRASMHRFSERQQQQGRKSILKKNNGGAGALSLSRLVLGDFDGGGGGGGGGGDFGGGLAEALFVEQLQEHQHQQQLQLQLQQAAAAAAAAVPVMAVEDVGRFTRSEFAAAIDSLTQHSKVTTTIPHP